MNKAREIIVDSVVPVGNYIIKAMRLTDCIKLKDLSTDYFPNGNPFTLFSVTLLPTENSSIEMNDVVTFHAMLATSNGEYREVPIEVGCWTSPLIFRGIKSADGIPTFSSSDSYSIGDVVMKDGVAYEFTANHTGAWSDSDVTTYSLIDLSQVDVYISPISDVII